MMDSLFLQCSWRGTILFYIHSTLSRKGFDVMRYYTFMLCYSIDAMFAANRRRGLCWCVWFDIISYHVVSYHKISYHSRPTFLVCHRGYSSPHRKGRYSASDLISHHTKISFDIIWLVCFRCLRWRWWTTGADGVSWTARVDGVSWTTGVVGVSWTTGADSVSWTARSW